MFSCALWVNLVSCKGEVIPETDNTDKTVDLGVKDTIDFKALVYIDEPSLNKRYGGEDSFKKNLRKFFNQTTTFWNNSKNKFDYYFRFIPADLKVYEHIEGEPYDDSANEAVRSLDLKYDFVVFFCLSAHTNTTACGSGGDGEYAVVWYTRTLESQKHDLFWTNREIIEPGTEGEWGVLGHEYGHFRGATDLYQYPIKAKNNPINGEEYHPGPCNMGTGEWVWSDYCSAVFNYTAKWKRIPKGFHGMKLVQGIELTVLKDGKPVKDAIVNLYGCRGSGGQKNLPSGDNGPDVYEIPFRTFKTDADGKVKINDAYHLYQVRTDGSEKLPDPLPWNYWFNFLVEASYGNEKAYIWMPDLEIQRQCMAENVTTYRANIILK